RCQAQTLGFVPFLLGIIPKSFLGAFAEGDVMQVLVVAILTAFALVALGERGQPVLRALDTGTHLFFGVLSLIVRLAPLGAFGAMAFTVGKYGLGSLVPLLKLMGGFYLTALVFIVAVLGL